MDSGIRHRLGQTKRIAVFARLGHRGDSLRICRGAQGETLPSAKLWARARRSQSRLVGAASRPSMVMGRWHHHGRLDVRAGSARPGLGGAVGSVHRWRKWCPVVIVRETETRSVPLTTSVSRGSSRSRPMHGKADSMRGWRTLLCHDEYPGRDRALNQVLINELHRTAAGVSAHWGIAVDDVLCRAVRAMHPHVRGDDFGL